MNDFVEAFRRKEAKKRLPVIRMEIDYELLTLHEALKVNDEEFINKTKVKLGQLRSELIQLQSY